MHHVNAIVYSVKSRPKKVLQMQIKSKIRFHLDRNEETASKLRW